MNTLADLAGIVVDKADGLVIIEGSVVLYVSNDHLARVSGAVDQNPFAVMRLPHTVIETARQSTATHEENQQQGVHNEDRQRIILEAQNPMHGNIKERRAQKHAVNNVAQIPNAGIAPKPLV